MYLKGHESLKSHIESEVTLDMYLDPCHSKLIHLLLGTLLGTKNLRMNNKLIMFSRCL